MSDIQYYVRQTEAELPDGYVLRTNMGNPKTGRGQAFFCTVCQHEFRESELVKFRGLWYCKPNRHIGEIASILKKEAADRYVPKPNGERGTTELVIRSS